MGNNPKWETRLYKINSTKMKKKTTCKIEQNPSRKEASWHNQMIIYKYLRSITA